MKLKPPRNHQQENTAARKTPRIQGDQRNLPLSRESGACEEAATRAEEGGRDCVQRNNKTEVAATCANEREEEVKVGEAIASRWERSAEDAGE